MSATFAWSVATPEATVAAGRCEFLVVPTPAGELGILPGHAPLIASVASGELRITSEGSVHSLRLGEGVVEVLGNAARLLVGRVEGRPPS